MKSFVGKLLAGTSTLGVLSGCTVGVVADAESDTKGPK